MEPFGLFQFLQNLLTPSTQTKENVTPTDLPEQPSPLKLNERDSPVSVTQNAAAQFLESHEKRAGRSPFPKR